MRSLPAAEPAYLAREAGTYSGQAQWIPPWVELAARRIWFVGRSTPVASPSGRALAAAWPGGEAQPGTPARCAGARRPLGWLKNSSIALPAASTVQRVLGVGFPQSGSREIVDVSKDISF